jgi:hypothetical protein
MTDETTTVVLQQVPQHAGAKWHDGPGWYYWEEEYPEEGSVGAFETRDEAMDHARESGVPTKFVQRAEATVLPLKGGERG